MFWSVQLKEPISDFCRSQIIILKNGDSMDRSLIIADMIIILLHTIGIFASHQKAARRNLAHVENFSPYGNVPNLTGSGDRGEGKEPTDHAERQGPRNQFFPHKGFISPLK